MSYNIVNISTYLLLLVVSLLTTTVMFYNKELFRIKKYSTNFQAYTFEKVSSPNTYFLN